MIVLGSFFKTKALFDQAMTHKSLSSESNNERLEFLGDAVLQFCVSGRLYEAYPTAREGELTKAQVRLVSGKHLVASAGKTDLLACLSHHKSVGKPTDSMIENAIEAVIGALYLDRGLAGVYRLIDAVVIGRLPSDINALIVVDSKTKLQECLQSRGLPLPSYRLLKQDAEHRFFEAECVSGDVVGRGVGQSKRDAEQEAAGEVLCQIQANP